MDKQPGNRGLVNRKAFSNSLRNDLSEAFDTLNKETKIPKSKLLDEAIEMLIEKYNTK
jgi:predicted DNA-binding protein